VGCAQAVRARTRIPCRVVGKETGIILNFSSCETIFVYLAFCWVPRAASAHLRLAVEALKRMCADWLREKHLAMSEQIVAGCASGAGHGGCDDVKSDSICESTLAFADSVTDSQALEVGGDVLSCSVTSAACDVRLFSFASPAHVVCSSDTELAVGEHNAAAQVSFCAVDQQWVCVRV
jgi:hypothetical protein